MKWTGIKAVDDAGAPVRIFGAPTFGSWRTTADPRLKELLRRVSFVMMDRKKRLSGPEGLFFALPALAMAGAMVARQFWPGIPVWMLVVALAIITLPFMHVGMRWSLARRSADLTRLMLEEGLCPCCGYNFFGMEISGLVTCPECGASWRADRIRRLLPIDEGATESVVAKVLRQPVEFTTKGIEDARGVRVAMVDPHLRAAIRAAAADAPRRHRLLAARRDTARIGRGLRLVVAGGFLLAAALFTRTMLRIAVIGPAIPLPGMLIGPLVMLGFAVSVLRGNFACTPRRVRGMMLSHNLCASCAASLEDLEPDPADGCLVCESCRAAWRV